LNGPVGSHSGRRERLSLRQAVRFGPGEAALVAVALVLLLAGGLMAHREIRATDRLLRAGHSDTARVLSSSYRGGKHTGSARLAYVEGARHYEETMAYDGPRLAAGSAVVIYTDAADPATFATDAGVDGESENLSRLETAGAVVAALGLAVLLLVLVSHQWRLEDGKLVPVVWRTPADARPRHGA
jgi:hypothetical protein